VRGPVIDGREPFGMSELTLQAARRIDPRRVGLTLLGLWLVFAALGIMVDRGHGSWTFQAFNLAHSDLGRRLSMPASFTALLVLLSAGLALALARVDRTRREPIWRLAAWALIALGLEHLLGVHSWLEARGVSWSACYLPLVILATAALLRALQIFRNQSKVQGTFGAAILLWLAGAALDNPDLISANVGTEILKMAAGVLFALSLLARLRYLAAQYYPLEEAHTRLSLDQIAAEVFDRVKFRPIAIGLILVAAAFGIQDVLLHTGDYTGHRVPILDVNAKQTLWATFQGSLIFSAALLSILIGRLRATPVEMWWLLLGAVLFVLGGNEIIALHDRFQDATGRPGQIVLTLFAIVGIVAWFKILDATSKNDRVRRLLIAGVAFWFVSQAIHVTFQGNIRWTDIRWTIVPEELLEALGSTCWLFALGYWLRAVLPVGVFPLKPVAGMLTGKTRITQLAESDRAGAPTG
jgi:hypothetical protein